MYNQIFTSHDYRGSSLLQHQISNIGLPLHCYKWHYDNDVYATYI